MDFATFWEYQGQAKASKPFLNKRMGYSRHLCAAARAPVSASWLFLLRQAPFPVQNRHWPVRPSTDLAAKSDH